MVGMVLGMLGVVVAVVWEDVDVCVVDDGGGGKGGVAMIIRMKR